MVKDMKKIKTVQSMAKKIKGLQKVIKCEDCGKVMFVRVTSKRRFCVECLAKLLHNEENLQRWAESHSSHAKSYHKKGNSYIHREVVEELIGRPLRSDEVVHHKDGNKHNNAVENLQVMTRSEHMKLHHKERREQRALALACATI